jgi:hypothetical protein
MFVALTIGLFFGTDIAPGCDIVGRYEGCWRSDKNGHNGRMTAEVCRIDNCSYRIVFRGTFWKVFPFRYAQSFAVSGTDAAGRNLQATRFLGPLLGTFDCHAVVNGNQMTATFQSKGDWGVFLLERACK